MRTTLKLQLLMLATIPGACGAPSSEAPTVVVRDSAGVRIVEHSARATPQQTWTIDLDGARELATPLGDAPLYRVSSAVRLDDGRVSVADAGNNRLLTFAPDGSLLSRLGRQGDGPGEFRNRLFMGPWLADFLAPEPGLQRAPIRLHHFGPDGHHIGAAGEVPGTEVFFTVDGSGQVALYPPHFSRGGNNLASECLLVAPNDTWELSFRSPDGAAVQIVRWLKPPEPVTAEATAESFDRLIERIPEPRRAAARAVADELSVHNTMPAFDRVFYDRLGRVWLQAYDPTEAVTVEWTVVGADGELLATTSLPRSLLFRDAGPDWVLVRVLDEVDVERLLLAEISPGLR